MLTHFINRVIFIHHNHQTIHNTSLSQHNIYTRILPFFNHFDFPKKEQEWSWKLIRHHIASSRAFFFPKKGEPSLGFHLRPPRVASPFFKKFLIDYFFLSSFFLSLSSSIPAKVLLDVLDDSVRVLPVAVEVGVPVAPVVRLGVQVGEVDVVDLVSRSGHLLHGGLRVLAAGGHGAAGRDDVRAHN